MEKLWISWFKFMRLKHNLILAQVHFRFLLSREYVKHLCVITFIEDYKTDHRLG